MMTRSDTKSENEAQSRYDECYLETLDEMNSSITLQTRIKPLNSNSRKKFL